MMRKIKNYTLCIVVAVFGTPLHAERTAIEKIEIQNDAVTVQKFGIYLSDKLPTCSILNQPSNSDRGYKVYLPAFGIKYPHNFFERISNVYNAFKSGFFRTPDFYQDGNIRGVFGSDQASVFRLRRRDTSCDLSILEYFDESPHGPIRYISYYDLDFQKTKNFMRLKITFHDAIPLSSPYNRRCDEFIDHCTFTSLSDEGISIDKFIKYFGNSSSVIKRDKLYVSTIGKNKKYIMTYNVNNRGGDFVMNAMFNNKILYEVSFYSKMEN